VAEIAVDQSIKIEQMNKDTVVAATKEKDSCAVVIDRRLKRMVLKSFAETLTRKRVFFSLYALCSALAVSKVYQKSDSVILDLEYEGNEVAVEEVFYSVSLKLGKDIKKNQISSRKLGKHSWCHLVSRNVNLAKKKIVLKKGDANRVLQLLGLK
jgi:hypothetical protein